MPSLSKGEMILRGWLEDYNISYQQEVRFSPSHRYRYDFVLFNQQNKPCLAVEVDGGPFPRDGAGHMSFSQYMSDKYRDNVSVYYNWSHVARIPSLWLYDPYKASTKSFKRMNKDEIMNLFLKFSLQQNETCVLCGK